MSAYRLEARHSISHDRARDRSNGIIQLRCTLTVYLLLLHPIIDVLLRNPISKRCPRAISIHNITSYVGLYGAKTWSFTIRLHTCKKKVRTHTWWGRPLPAVQLEELPLQLLARLEHALNRAWYMQTRSSLAHPKRPYGVLQMLA